MIGSLLSRIVSFALIGAVLFGAGFYAGQQYDSNDRAGLETAGQSEPLATVSVMLDFGNGTVKTVNDIPWNTGQTVFDVLKKLDTEKKLALSYKDYGGELGAFIEGIDGVKSSSKTWWQYWVNNRYSTRGVSSFTLSAGDVIEFKLIQEQKGEQLY